MRINGASAMHYTLKDHQGNLTATVCGNAVERLNYDAWGRQRNPNGFGYSNVSHTFDRGYTLHEHYDRFKIINANARLYDPVIGRFFSPDPFVQTPDFSQNFNRYSYCLNNPVMYNDPDGEFFWAPVIVGAMVGAYFGAVRAGIQGGSAGDCMLGFAIGGLGGGLGGYVGQSVAGLLGTATTIGQAFTNGAIIGGSSSFTNSFIYTAGNSWIEGASFKQGLINGIVTGGSSALLGGITGGVLGSIQYQRQIFIFQRGCVELGVDGGGPVPATDQFLSDAQKAWYPDAPMKNVHDFTVERVPDNAFIGKGANAPGVTRYLKEVNVLTGMSDVYFNKDLAFSSAKQLFYTMGHEFVHVSQFAALAGQSASILTSDFMDMLDYYAYGYQNYLGGLQLNSFSKEDILRWSISSPQFDNMNYIKFAWCFKHSFIYPF